MDNTVYIEAGKGQLSELYYQVSWKNYSKNEGTWKPASAIMYLPKMISIFHKDHLKKHIAMFLPLDSALLIARPNIKQTTRQKYGRNRYARSAKLTNKTWLWIVQTYKR